MASEAGCPIEMHKIPIDKCDEMYDEVRDVLNTNRKIGGRIEG